MRINKNMSCLMSSRRRRSIALAITWSYDVTGLQPVVAGLQLDEDTTESRRQRTSRKTDKTRRWSWQQNWTLRRRRCCPVRNALVNAIIII